MSHRPGSARSKRPRVAVVVESDIPRLAGLLPWERELLLPIVGRLVEEALVDAEEREQAGSINDDE